MPVAPSAGSAAGVRTLIVANPSGEAIVGDQSRLGVRRRQGSRMLASRLVWLLRDGDLLLTACPPSSQFVEYALDLMGVLPSSVAVIRPPGSDGSGPLLTPAVLGSPELCRHVRPWLSECGRWRARAYHFDASVCALVDSLGIDLQPVFRSYACGPGPRRLNSKVAFRRIAAAAGVRIARGKVCASQAELLAAIDGLLQVTGSVVVKQDVSASGHGNVLVTTTGATGIGTRDTVHLGTERSTGDAARQLWTDLTDRVNARLVAEVFHPDAPSYSAECEIDEESGWPRVLNVAEHRMEPAWVGLELPAPTLSATHLAAFTAGATALTEVAGRMGFRYRLNVDGMTVGDDVLFNEVNGRVGGCTHIHEIAVRVLGPRYLEHVAVVTRNAVPSPRFERGRAALLAGGLLYPDPHGEGIVIVGDDTDQSGTVDYMVIGRDRARSLLIEAEGRRLLERESRR